VFTLFVEFIEFVVFVVFIEFVEFTVFTAYCQLPIANCLLLIAYFPQSLNL
jgi:hypothetical protein